MRRKNGEVFPLLALILKGLHAKNRESFPLFALDAVPPRANKRGVVALFHPLVLRPWNSVPSKRRPLTPGGSVILR
jgi:hypothetical protein